MGGEVLSLTMGMTDWGGVVSMSGLKEHPEHMIIYQCWVPWLNCPTRIPPLPPNVKECGVAKLREIVFLNVEFGSRISSTNWHTLL